MGTTSNTEPEDSYLDNLFGSTEYQPEAPAAKKDFFPWHKPRKQFIRAEQWSVQILKLIEDLGSDFNQITYLGLPGDDLLDLRHFHEVICVPKGLNLKFLGFNTAKSGAKHTPDLEISLDEVIKLPHIDKSSDVIPDDFCQIGNPKSIAHEHCRKAGPFDIINIDLCDGFAQHKASDPNHFNALNQLMAIQARRKSPWLLLLTTRTGNEYTDSSRFGTLKDLYEKNLNECAEFQQASIDAFSVEDRVSLDEYCLKEEGASNIFLTSLCKWIINRAIHQNPPSTFELKSAIGYRVKDEALTPDLVSIAIRINPTFQAMHDTTGLANSIITQPNEGILATRALKRVNKLKDADTYLEANADVMQSMIDASKKLLEKARYDINSYNQWLGVEAI